MAGKGLRRVGAELLHPLPQNILVNVQVAAGLRHRQPVFPDQLDRFDRELATELPSSVSSSPTSGSMKHLIPVSIKPAAAHPEPFRDRNDPVTKMIARKIIQIGSALLACTVSPIPAPTHL
jgi:hypothetical protein